MRQKHIEGSAREAIAIAEIASVGGLTRQQQSRLSRLHRVLEAEYPRVEPDMRAWSYGTKPVHTYTHELMRAIKVRYGHDYM